MLKPDGVFIATMFGHDTLYQLNTAMRLAEIERNQGFSPRVSPMVHLADMGRLLHSAGYKLLTLDVDEIVVNYPDAIELMRDLRGMGESKSFFDLSLQSTDRSSRDPKQNNNYLSPDILMAVSSIYRAMYGGTKYDENSKLKINYVPATFQIINMIGWKPDISQPQPLERGTGQFSFKDIEKLEELLVEKSK